MMNELARVTVGRCVLSGDSIGRTVARTGGVCSVRVAVGTAGAPKEQAKTASLSKIPIPKKRVRMSQSLILKAVR